MATCRHIIRRHKWNDYPPLVYNSIPQTDSSKATPYNSQLGRVGSKTIIYILTMQHGDKVPALRTYLIRAPHCNSDRKDYFNLGSEHRKT